jgi:hypothetical protein
VDARDTDTAATIGLVIGLVIGLRRVHERARDAARYRRPGT